MELNFNSIWFKMRLISPFNFVKKRFFSRGQEVSVYEQNIVHGEHSIVKAKILFRNRLAKVSIGEKCTLAGNFYLNTEKANINIGDNVWVGGNTIIECTVGINIESDVLISYQCILQDSNSHSLKLSERINDNIEWSRLGRKNWEVPISSPIKIGRGCWLGARVMILKGVQLGEGCVVGAGAVVTRSFPPWSVIAGNPAKLIRTLAENER